MTDIADLKRNIQQEEVQFRSAVSESTWSKIGGSINFINDRQYDVKDFRANGQYNVTGINETGFDGIYVFPFDCEIFYVVMYNTIPGTSSFTQIDIKKTPNSGTTFSTIFTVAPSIGYNADHTDVAYIATGQTGTGMSAPILITTPFNVSAGEAIRADFTFKQAGNPENTGILVYFRPR